MASPVYAAMLNLPGLVGIVGFVWICLDLVGIWLGLLGDISDMCVRVFWLGWVKVFLVGIVCLGLFVWDLLGSVGARVFWSWCKGFLGIVWGFLFGARVFWDC